VQQPTCLYEFAICNPAEKQVQAAHLGPVDRPLAGRRRRGSGQRRRTASCSPAARAGGQRRREVPQKQRRGQSPARPVLWRNHCILHRRWPRSPSCNARLRLTGSCSLAERLCGVRSYSNTPRPWFYELIISCVRSRAEINRSGSTRKYFPTTVKELLCLTPGITSKHITYNIEKD
jgi:hypothetical protein